MGKCDPQNPNPREWRVLYRKTILETSRSTIAKELSDAENAIVGRRRHLFQDSGAEVEQERGSE